MSQQSSQKIVSLLNDFEQAVRQENAQDAEDILERLFSIYENKRQNELELAIQSRVAEVDSSEQKRQDSLNDYVNNFVRSKNTRLIFKIAAGSIVGNFDEFAEGSEFDEIQSEMNDAIDNLKEVEPELEESQEQAEQEIQKLEIPPNIQVLSAEQVTPEEVEVGEETDVEMVLSNIGDSTAEGVTVTLKADNMEISTKEFSVGSLTPKVNERLRPTVTPNETGNVELSVQADSDNAGSATDSVSIISIEAGEDTDSREDRRDLSRGETEEQPRRRRDRGRGDPETGSRRRDRGRDSGRDGSSR